MVFESRIRRRGKRHSRLVSTPTTTPSNSQSPPSTTNSCPTVHGGPRRCCRRHFPPSAWRRQGSQRRTEDERAARSGEGPPRWPVFSPHQRTYQEGERLPRCGGESMEHGTGGYLLRRGRRAVCFTSFFSLYLTLVDSHLHSQSSRYLLRRSSPTPQGNRYLCWLLRVPCCRKPQHGRNGKRVLHSVSPISHTILAHRSHLEKSALVAG